MLEVRVGSYCDLFVGRNLGVWLEFGVDGVRYWGLGYSYGVGILVYLRYLVLSFFFLGLSWGYVKIVV